MYKQEQRYSCIFSMFFFAIQFNHAEIFVAYSVGEHSTKVFNSIYARFIAHRFVILLCRMIQNSTYNLLEELENAETKHNCTEMYDRKLKAELESKRRYRNYKPMMDRKTPDLTILYT